MSETKQREEQRELERQVEELKRIFNAIELSIKKEKNPSDALDRCEQMIDDLSKHYPDDLNRIFWFTDQLFEKTVAEILKRSDVSEQVAGRMNQYIQRVLTFLTPYVDRDIGPVLTTIAYIFRISRTCVFYMHYGTDENISQFSNFQVYNIDDEEEEEELKACLVRDRWPSLYFYSNLRLFVKLRIIDLIVARLKDRDHRPPLHIMKGLLRIVARVRNYFNPHYFEKLGPAILQCTTEHLKNLTDDDLKNEDKKVASDILRYLEDILTPSSNATRESLERLRLEVDFKFLKCPYLEKRIQGLNDIREFINVVMAKKEGLRHQMYLPTVANYDTYPVVIDTQGMVSWLKTNGIVEYLYGENLHIELIKRSLEILKFIAVEGHMTKEYIDLLWQVSLTKHETICQTVWNNIKALSSVLSSELIDYLLEKIQQIPVNEYTPNTLLFIREITLASIQYSVNTNVKRVLGLELMWNLIQDETKTSSEVVLTALNVLQEFLSFPVCYSQRNRFISLCLQNLKEGKSITQTLHLLTKIFGTFPKKDDKESVVNLIGQIEKQFGMLSLFFKDLQRYKETVQTAVANARTHIDINNFVIGKFTHLQHMKERLEFLDFVLGNSKITLTCEQLDVLWDCTIVKALTPEERDIGFQWFENANTSTANKEFCSCGDREILYLFEKKFPELNLTTLTPHGFNLFEFFFKTVNIKQQRFELVIDKNVPTKEFKVRTFEIAGMDLLWRICLEAYNNEVGQLAINFLNRIYKSVVPELKPQLGKQREKYLHFCMEKLATAANEYFQQKNTDFRVQLTISRCLSLIKALIETFEGTIQRQRHGTATRGIPIAINVGSQTGIKFPLQLYSNDTVGVLRKKIAEHVNESPEYLRLITLGKELTDDNALLSDLKFVENQHVYFIKHMKRNADGAVEVVPRPLPTPNTSVTEISVEDPTLPSHILSQDKYFEQLFQLLNLQGPVGAQVWDLLMKLPTNQRNLEQLRRLQTSTDVSNRTNWNELLDSSSLFKLLYSLQIIESLMYQENPTDKTQLNEWCRQFVERGGVLHLLQILLNVDFFDEARGNKRIACLASLLKVIDFFILATPKSPSDIPTLRQETLSTLSSVKLPDLIHKLLLITFRAVTEKPNQQSEEVTATATARPTTSEIDNDLVIRFAMPLLVAVVVRNQDCLKAMLSSSLLGQWLNSLLLLTSSESTRQYTATGIYQICKQITNPQLIEPQFFPHKFFLNKLLNLISTIQPTSTTCEQYFDLLNKLINDVCDGVGGGRPSEFSDLLRRIIKMIQKHPIIEVNNDTREDKVLIGLMNVVCTLVSKDTSFKILAGSPQDGNLIEEIFHKCLFDIPQQRFEGNEAILNRKRDVVTPPRCKTSASRATAYRLLGELVRDCPTNFELLINKLIAHHTLEEPRDQWAYQPAAYEKAPCGYVGLKNMGATCYMNSLMQQFFMIPQFRYGILSVPDRSPDKNESLLYQLQAIFVNLQESEKKFYDPKSFCRAYKPDGQPVNPSIQMDVDEFFNMLFDKLETLLKGTPQETILKHFFGGTIVNQIISRECEHTSEREESFFTFSVEVKNKRSLLESLELFVQGDMLEGDNKYHCSTCNKKVDALKRCCIKSLPNNLIIHLKRFEFDLELMRRTKVNEYCEFPLKLNLEPYTFEGLTRREAIAKSKDPKMFPPIHPLEYYDYELTGILVHTGTAESGHYYSFIRERDPPPGVQPRWYHFNDMLVEPFDPSEIGAQCFGGEETTMTWDAVQNKRILKPQLKPNNAYMLFYTKVIPNPEPSKQPTSEEERELSINANLNTTSKSLRSSKTYTSREALESFSSLSTSPLSSSYINPQTFPHDLFIQVWRENQQFLHDKHIFDPAYFNFVNNILMMAPDQLSSKDMTDGDEERNVSSDPLFKVIELGTRFFIETLAHAKDRETMNDLITQLMTRYSTHIPACKWFLETLIKSDQQWVKHILFHCPTSEVREKFAKLLIHIIVTLVPTERQMYFEEDSTEMEIEKEREGPEREIEMQEVSKGSEEATLLFLKPKGTPKSLIIRFMDSYLALLKEAHQHWRNFTQYFLVLEEFALLGPREREYLLKRKAISVLIDFYLGDESPRNAKQAKSTKKTKAEQVQIANMRHIVGCLSALIRGCVIPLSTANAELTAGTTLNNTTQQSVKSTSPYRLPGDLHSIDSEDWEMIASDKFFERIIGDGAHMTASAELVCYLCWENEQISKHVIKLINDQIDRLNYESYRPYFFVFSHVLRIHDSLQRQRIFTAMTGFLEVIARNLKYKSSTYYCVKFLLENCPLLPDLRAFLYQNIQKWTEELLFYKNSELVRYATEALILALIPEIPGYDTGLPKDDFTTGASAQLLTLSESNNVPTEQRQQLTQSVPVVGLETDPAKVDERFQNIYRHLLTLLAPARNCTLNDVKNFTKTADEGYPLPFWRLISLIRLLDWGMKSDREKLMFGEYLDDFFKLMAAVDQQQHECDQNKLYMTALLDKATENCPDNVRRIVEDERFGVRSFDWFISLRNCPAFISYNDEQIHHAYNVYLRCIEMDPTFAEKWCLHRNFDWNTRYLYIEPCEYPKTAERQHKILAVALKSPNGPKFRQHLIQRICASYEKFFTTNYKNILNLSNLCMMTNDDKLLFIERRSPQFLTKFILTLNWIENGQVNPYLAILIDFLNRQIEWLTADNLPERVLKVKSELFAMWNDRLKLVERLGHYNLETSHETLVSSSRQLLSTLCKLDLNCAIYAVSFFFQHHESQLETTLNNVLATQSMETEHDPKVLSLRQQYYSFLSKLALYGIDFSTKRNLPPHTLEQSVGLLSLVALECLNMPSSVLLPIIQTWVACLNVSVGESALQKTLKDNQFFITFITRLLSKYIHHFDQKEIAQFASTVFQDIKLDKEIKGEMVQFYVDKLQTLLQQLDSLRPSTEQSSIELTVSNLISFCRGVQILSSDTEFKALFSQLLNEKMKLLHTLVNNIQNTPLTKSKRREELLEIVNNFTKASSQ